jgi:hypothetical protein
MVRSSAQLNGPLGQAAPESLDHRALRGEVGLARAEGDEQRDEVLGARMVRPGRGSLAGEIEQCVYVAVLEDVSAPVVELARPPRYRALEH